MSESSPVASLAPAPNLLFDLTGRSALVTGAGGGIGAAVAQALATAGAAVLVTDISADAAAAVAERINAAGGKADSVALDVSDRESAEAAAARAAGLAEGKLHILVNNAGVTAPAMFPKLTDETFRLTFDIHVMGTFHCAQAALPHMPTDGTGRIINVTSAAGLTGTLGQVNYSAAKAGIIGFTKSLARELAAKNILVNALAPLAATPMTETIRTNEKFAANMMQRIPLKRWAAGRRGRRGVRLPGFRRRVVRHRPGAAGRRRHGHVRAMTEHSSAPLAGITIVAMEQAVSAPMCTRVLADFGARVIKVENPRGGDFARDYDDVVNGLAAHFVWANRGKESVTLDLKSEAGMDVLHRLLDRADALVSNLAPGATARMGLGPGGVAAPAP